MRIILVIATFSLLCITCKQVKNERIAYQISEKDLIPEGITYSSTTNSFYLSSIYKTKIIQIDAESGDFKDFIPSDLLNLSFLGLIVDDGQKYLWACGYGYRNGKKFSLVNKFHLISGDLIKSYSINDTLEHLYNDLVKDTEGNIFFTDTERQTIFKIDKETDSVEVFYDGIEILYPNGITISSDSKYLFVASTTHGIRVLDIQKKSIIGEPDSIFNSTGIDGLKYYQKSLIGIQNEVQQKSDVKIVRFFLDETNTKIIGMRIIDQNNPDFDIPTTFVMVGSDLYCLANSQLWNLNSTECKILQPDRLKEVIILSYEI